MFPACDRQSPVAARNSMRALDLPCRAPPKARWRCLCADACTHGADVRIAVLGSAVHITSAICGAPRTITNRSGGGSGERLDFASGRQRQRSGDHEAASRQPPSVHTVPARPLRADALAVRLFPLADWNPLSSDDTGRCSSRVRVNAGPRDRYRVGAATATVRQSENFCRSRIHCIPSECVRWRRRWK